DALCPPRETRALFGLAQARPVRSLDLTLSSASASASDAGLASCSANPPGQRRVELVGTGVAALYSDRRLTLQPSRIRHGGDLISPPKGLSARCDPPVSSGLLVGLLEFP